MEHERRYNRYLTIPLLAATCLAFRVLGPAQTTQEPQVNIEPRPAPKTDSTGGADRLAPSIRVNSDLVLIPVSVTDRQDRPITGLNKEHFKLYDEKVEQVISHFNTEDAPVSIGVVFDCSGSMGPKLEKSRRAVAEFLKAANPDDEFSLVEFNDHAQLVVGFTNHIEEIQNRLIFTQSRGATALLDAIYLSIHELKRARHTRKALLIISDGGDNCSRYTEREVKNYVRESDVQIYSLGILEPFGLRNRSPEEMSGPALLDDVAHETGGRLFEVDDLNELRDIASKIGTALRNQYVLGYAPNVVHDGKYHRIQVKVEKLKGLPPMHATFRAGYYAR